MGRVDKTALVLCIIFPILAILAVAARFRARAIKKIKLGADDWVIVLALILAVANAINVLYGAITANLGQRSPLHTGNPAQDKQTAENIVALNKMSLAAEVINPVAITLARFSILLFYTRIFHDSSRYFRIVVYVMYAVNLAWGIAFTFAYLLECVPIDQLWTKPQTERTHCVNQNMNYYYSIFTIIIDVLILTIPWPIVWRLKMPLRYKIAVLGIFALGGIVTAVSIGKCYTFFTIGVVIAKDHDLTYHEAPIFYWTVPETCLFVVCACLPTLRPLFHGMSPESVIRSLRSALSLSSLRTHNSTRFDTQPYSSGWEENDTHQSSVGLRKASTEPKSSGVGVELHDLENGYPKIKSPGH